ncbi:MAG: transcription antitermination factor NusB [Planctomycetota bacterium]
MSLDRRHARILAMQALCQLEVQGAESLDRLDGLFELLEADENATSEAKNLINAYRELHERIDDEIQSAATHWDIQRISPVERNVLRVATVELIRQSAPTKVVINEAIEIAKEYCGADSPRFVNGVLDVIAKRRPTSEGEDL